MSNNSDSFCYNRYWLWIGNILVLYFRNLNLITQKPLSLHPIFLNINKILIYTTFSSIFNLTHHSHLKHNPTLPYNIVFYDVSDTRNNGVISIFNSRKVINDIIIFLRNTMKEL